MTTLVRALTVVLILVALGNFADMASARPGDVLERPTPGQEAREPVPRPRIALRGDLLSVKVDNAPWGEVLKELAQQTGMTIRVLGPLRGTLTQEFADLPLAQGLRRLFREANFVFSYAKGGQQGTAADQSLRVWLFPQEGSARAQGYTPSAERLAAQPEAESARAPLAAVGPGEPAIEESAPEAVGQEEEPETAMVVQEDEPASEVVILGEERHEATQ